MDRLPSSNVYYTCSNVHHPLNSSHFTITYDGDGQVVIIVQTINSLDLYEKEIIDSRPKTLCILPRLANQSDLGPVLDWTEKFRVSSLKLGLDGVKPKLLESLSKWSYLRHPNCCLNDLKLDLKWNTHTLSLLNSLWQPFGQHLTRLELIVTQEMLEAVCLPSLLENMEQLDSLILSNSAFGEAKMSSEWYEVLSSCLTRGLLKHVQKFIFGFLTPGSILDLIIEHCTDLQVLYVKYSNSESSKDQPKTCWMKHLLSPTFKYGYLRIDPPNLSSWREMPFKALWINMEISQRMFYNPANYSLQDYCQPWYTSNLEEYNKSPVKVEARYRYFFE